MTEENVISIDKKATDIKEKYMSISSKYFDARKKLLELSKKFNDFQMEFNQRPEIVELQTEYKVLNDEITKYLQELGEIELESAGIEAPTAKKTEAETKAVEKIKEEEKKDE